MGIEHPYLAMLALIMFTVGVIGAIYLYIHIYSETLKTPVLSVSAISCYNNTSTILSIIIRHERGDIVELRKVQLTSDIGLINIDVSEHNQDVYVEMVNFNRLLYPGQIGKLVIKLRHETYKMYTENRTYHIVLYFDKTTAIASFEIVACEKLALGIDHLQLYTVTVPYTTTLSYTVTLPTTITMTPPAYLLITAPPSITLEYPPALPPEVFVTRTSRGAIVYTDFESISHPMPGWRTYGGSWTSQHATDIAKGYLLQGLDDNRGLGGASYYYPERRLDSYTSLWIAVKARRTAGRDWFGIALLNRDINRVYVIGIEDDRSELEIRSYNVESSGGWSTLHQGRFTYTRGDWYIIVARYDVTTTSVVIHVWVYNKNGVLLASTATSSTHFSRFTPAYIGVFVDGPTAQFDDFIISTKDPRIILFNMPRYNMVVELWDNLGNLVASTTATNTQFNLSILRDVVVGTGSGGRIVFRHTTGTIFAEYRASETDAILGGDTYTVDVVNVNYISKFVVGVNNLFAYVDLSIPTNIYVHNLYIVCLRGNAVVRLKLVDYNNLDSDTILTISLVVEDATGDMQRIEVVGFSINSDSTSQISIAGRGYIAVSGSIRSNTFLYLLLECYSSTNLDRPVAHVPIILEFKAT